jgi:hypothetical protein
VLADHALHCRPPSNIVDLACHQQKASLATLMSDYPTGGSTQECSFAWLAQQVQRATHVEWWAHTRVPPLTSHQLHWDCDERRLRRVGAGWVYAGWWGMQRNAEQNVRGLRRVVLVGCNKLGSKSWVVPGLPEVASLHRYPGALA